MNSKFTTVSLRKESGAKLDYLCSLVKQTKTALLERAIEDLYAKLVENRIEKVVLTEVEPGSLRYDVFYKDKTTAVQVHKKGEFTVTQETINFITLMQPVVMDNRSVVYQKQSDPEIEVFDSMLMNLGHAEFGWVHFVCINGEEYQMAAYNGGHVLYNKTHYWKSYPSNKEIALDGDDLKNLVASMLKIPGVPHSNDMWVGYHGQFKEFMEYYLTGGWRARAAK